MKIKMEKGMLRKIIGGALLLMAGYYIFRGVQQTDMLKGVILGVFGVFFYVFSYRNT